MKIEVIAKPYQEARKGDLVVVKQLTNDDKIIHYLISADGIEGLSKTQYKLFCLDSSQIIPTFASSTILGLMTNLRLNDKLEIIEIIPREEIQLSRVLGN